MERGIYIAGSFIESGAQETTNRDTNKKETKRYVLISVGGTRSDSVPRVKMSDAAWTSLVNSDCQLGDEVILRVRPFAQDGHIYYTADSFAVSGGGGRV